MIENIKSVLLVLLVALSLYLTYQLWYGQKPADLVIDNDFERIVVEKPRPLTDVIIPRQIMLKAEGGYYMLRDGEESFSLIWEAISQVLQETYKESIIAQDFSEMEWQNKLTVYLDPHLPVGDDLPWLSGEEYALLNRVELNYHNGENWLIINKAETNKRLNLTLNDEQQEQISELLAQINADDKALYFKLTADYIFDLSGREFAVQNPIYAPAEEVSMELAQFRPEIINRDLLLKTFFVDYSMARIIEEKDGSLIYTDGERGLRLGSVGLEFTNPRIEERHTSSSAFTYVEALTTSSATLSYHGGWPEGLRLESIGLTGWGPSASYLAEWRTYFRGYPLFLSKPTRAFFNDRGLYHYTRSQFIADDLSEVEIITVAPWLEALVQAAQLFEEKQPNLKSLARLEVLELGYVLTGDPPFYQGVPVWLVQINDQQFHLKADTLDFIAEVDLL
jgi:regulatory protein YycH of two-component signal transduction system YycFG